MKATLPSSTVFWGAKSVESKTFWYLMTKHTTHIGLDVTSRNWGRRMSLERRKKLTSSFRRRPSGLMVWTKSKSYAGSTSALIFQPRLIFWAESGGERKRRSRG